MQNLSQAVSNNRFWISLVAFCLLSSAAQAQSMSAERALAQLVKDIKRAQPALANNGSEDGYYTTRPGDTVDMILNRMLPNMPVRRDILRKALVKANPHAFKRSNPNWMYANKKLKLPGATDIHNVVFTDQANDKKSNQEERLSWVKFP
ncbi:hypothetical protein OAI12_01555 [Porticoccaceae bacterium]|nr:hypothetical protein [Porticoccaceae bacterium]